MIEFYKRTLKDRTLKKLDKYDRGSWIRVIDPSEEEIDSLVSNFNLDKQNILSGLDSYEVPRVEQDENTTYLIIKSVSDKTKYPETFLIILTDNYILTLCKHELSFLDVILKNKLKFVTTQRKKSLLTLLKLINKKFENATLKIVKHVKQEKESFQDLNDKQISALLEQEDVLNYYVMAYYQLNVVYTRIIKLIKFFEEDKELLDDLKIETEQGYELCKASLKTISNIRHHADVLLSHKLNNVITILTIFTVLISVPAAISGLYGMNLTLPFQQSPYAFYYIVGIILVLWFGFIKIMKKKKIL